MHIVNNTSQDYWFGPLHLPASGTLDVDDTSSTSLYLTNDQVADAINNLSQSDKITVSLEAQPFPRPTGVPQLLHGDGSPEGLVYASAGSLYMRRDVDIHGTDGLYVKTSGITISTGWQVYAAASTLSRFVCNTTPDTSARRRQASTPAPAASPFRSTTYSSSSSPAATTPLTASHWK